MLGLLLKNKFPDMHLKVLTYEPAVVVEEGMAERISQVQGLKLLCFVNKNDIVPRLTMANAVELFETMEKEKEEAAAYVAMEYGAAFKRVFKGWPDQQRLKKHLRDGASHEGESDGSGDEEGMKVADELERLAAMEGMLKELSKADEENEENKDGEKNTTAAADEASAASGESKVNNKNKSEPLKKMVLPGVIYHAYEWQGQTKCSIISSDHPSLKLVPTMTCIDEHTCVGWTQSLRDIQISQGCHFEGSKWPQVSSNVDDFPKQKCYVCQFPLRWRCGDVGNVGGGGGGAGKRAGKGAGKGAGGEGEEEKKARALQMVAVRNCDRCPACGNVVCKSCLTKSKSLPGMGLGEQLSICNACYYGGV